MESFAIKTKVVQPEDSLLDVLNEYVIDIRENDVLVIATKIVSITQNRLATFTKEDEGSQSNAIMMSEADYFIDPSYSQYGLMVTIKNSRLGLKAGVDHTNCPKQTYVLWPEDPQKVANDVWNFLQEKFKVKNLGVVIADTTSIPLRKGFIGGCVSYCGFKPFITDSSLDLFGERKKSTVNYAENAAVVGVSEMGELDEQTPLAIVRNLKGVEFSDSIPSQEELDSYYLTLENDVFSPALKNAPWESVNE